MVTKHTFGLGLGASMFVCVRKLIPLLRTLDQLRGRPRSVRPASLLPQLAAEEEHDEEHDHQDDHRPPRPAVVADDEADDGADEAVDQHGLGEVRDQVFGRHAKAHEAPGHAREHADHDDADHRDDQSG